MAKRLRQRVTAKRNIVARFASSVTPTFRAEKGGAGAQPNTLACASRAVTIWTGVPPWKERRYCSQSRVIFFGRNKSALRRLGLCWHVTGSLGRMFAISRASSQITEKCSRSPLHQAAAYPLQQPRKRPRFSASVYNHYKIVIPWQEKFSFNSLCSLHSPNRCVHREILRGDFDCQITVM